MSDLYPCLWALTGCLFSSILSLVGDTELALPLPKAMAHLFGTPFAFMLSPIPILMNFKSGISPLVLSGVSWLADFKLLVQCSLQNALRANANRSTSPELLPAFVLIFHYPSVKTQVSVMSLNENSEAPVSFQKTFAFQASIRRSGLCLPSPSVWSAGKRCKRAQYEQGTLRQFQAIHKYLRANKSQPQRWAHEVCSAAHGLVAPGCDGGSWWEPSLLLWNSLLSPEAPTPWMYY